MTNCQKKKAKMIIKLTINPVDSRKFFANFSNLFRTFFETSEFLAKLL